MIDRIERNLSKLSEFLNTNSVPKPPLGGRLINSGLLITGLVGFLYSFNFAYNYDPSGNGYVEIARMLNGLAFLQFTTALIAEWKAATISVPIYIQLLKQRIRSRDSIRAVQNLMSRVKSNPKFSDVSLKAVLSKFQRANANRSQKMAQISLNVWEEYRGIQAEQIEQLRLKGFFQKGRGFWQAITSLRNDMTVNEREQYRAWLNGKNVEIDSQSLGRFEHKLLHLEKKVEALLEKEGFITSRNMAHLLSQELAAMEAAILAGRMKKAGISSFVEVNNILLGISIGIIGMMASVGSEPVALDQAFSFQIIETVRLHWHTLLRVGGVLTLPAIGGFWLGLANWMNRRPPAEDALEVIRNLRKIVDSKLHKTVDTIAPALLSDQSVAEQLSEQLVKLGMNPYERPEPPANNFIPMMKAFCGRALAP